MRRIFGLLRASLVALACIAAAPSRPAAMPAPDAATLAAWQGACDSSRAVRIVTIDARFEATRLSLDDSGVRFGLRAQRAAFVVVDAPAGDERHIAWADIDRIDSRAGNGAGRGLVTGGLVGGALGGVLVAGIHNMPLGTEQSTSTATTLAVLMGIGGAAIGALIGLGITHWTHIAP
jgi:hypothetical protein